MRGRTGKGDETRNGPRRREGRNGPGERTTSGPTLFAGPFRPPPARPYPPRVRLRHELETLGLLVSRHPLELYRERLAGIRLVPGARLREHVGRRVTTVGWLVTAKVVLTRRGEPMEFVSFEDETALYETTFFPGAYARFSALLDDRRAYLLRGRVEEDLGAVSLTVEEVTPLEELGELLAGR